jgi:hypothetical protein
MQDTAMRELDEAAPPAFVNGVDTHGQRPTRAQARAAKPAARPAAARSAVALAPAEAAVPFAWSDGLATMLRLHEDWRQRVARMAQAQLAFVAEAGGEMLAVGRALAAEPDPTRRLELVCNQALRQIEHSIAVSTRVLEAWGGDASEASDRRPG